MSAPAAEAPLPRGAAPALPPPTPLLPLPIAFALDTPRLESAAIEALYNAAILRDGTVDVAVRQLELQSKDTKASPHARANALLAAGHLQWRFGRLPAATDLIDRALALETTGELTFLQARLLEAAGKLPEARRGYEQTLTLLTDPELKEDVQLRLTFLVTDAQNVSALVALAQTRDRDFRNRAAVALAILSHPGEAADLYEVFGDGSQRQHQHLRLAQWALQAGQAQKAQDQAWLAVQTATLTRDVRYSLSVLMEAHELDASWERLLTKFTTVANPSADIKNVRVDILRKLRRFDEAIALIESDRAQGMSPEGQRRLLRMYGEAGRTDALVTEFRKLIANEPAELAWPRGLSEHFLEQGRREDAAQLWREFTARNTNTELLMEAGLVMGQLGFNDLALAVADRCLVLAPENASRVQWYRFQYFLKRGETGKAEDVLRALEKDLPADSPALVEVADSYERIKNPALALAVWEKLALRPGGLGVDEKMRLAWFYDTVGRREQALTIWKNLWDKEVPESRRKLVEDRLLLLAAETGTLGEIAVDLEQKLAQGTAVAKDSALLIRIYSEVGDPASAIEVIHEYFRRQAKTPASEIASLKEQARVYQSLNRFVPFTEVTEKLILLDPENRTDYLQSLVLNHIERGGRQDAEQLQKRLTQLREASASAGDEFEAGVLVMANLKDKAIDSYRRALARNPGHSDNYLLLADLLKQNRRIDEGLAILQYFAEIAPADDGFVVAIDGILNLNPASDSPALRWAHRRVLERLARRDDKFYLYELSGELAEGAKDKKTYLASLENSLVEAGPRRTSVLRELISATEEKADTFQPATTPPDYRRNLSYSRRLVALGEELPPDVYLNLGRTFLRMNNPVEALEAFNLAIDRTDRTSLVEESADRFEAAGYSAEATVLYEKALTADADSIGVLAKLANMRSRDGAVGLANDLYLRTLLKLSAQQPIEVETSTAPRRAAIGFSNPQDQNFTFLYRRYYWTLQNGLLFTLTPDKPDALAPVEAALDQALQEVVQRAGGRPTKPFASYPRLNILARLARLSALHAGLYDQADRFDLKLLRSFGGDAKFVTDLVNQRLAWSLVASAEKLRLAEGVLPKIQSDLAAKTRAVTELAPLTQLSAAARQALSRRNFNQAADFALAAGDPALAATIYQEWLSVRRDSPAAAGADNNAVAARAMQTASVAAASGGMVLAAPMGAARVDANNPALIAAQARRRLDPERYAALSRQIVGLAAANPDLARDMLTARTQSGFQSSLEKSVLFSIEEAAGQKLFTEQKLTAVVTALTPPQVMALDMDYTLNSLPPAARVALFLRYLAASPPTAIAPAIPLLRLVLAQPIDAASATRISTAFKTRFAAIAKTPFGLRMVGNMLSNVSGSGPAADSSNLGFLDELDRHLAETYTENFTAGSFKALVLRGTGTAKPSMTAVMDTVFREISQLPPDYPAIYIPSVIRRSLSQQAELIYPQRKAELLSLLEKKSQETAVAPEAFWTSEPEVTPAVFHVTMAVYANDPAGDPKDPLVWLERVRKNQPNFKPVLDALLSLYAQLGRPDQEREILEHLIKVAPDSDAYRQRLAAFWRNYDHPENALVALGSRLRPPEAAASAVPAGSMASYYLARVPQIGKFSAQLTSATSPATARPALRGLLQMGVPQNLFYQMTQSGVPALDYASLLDLTWNAAANADTAGFVKPLLPWIESTEPQAGEPGQAARLLDRVSTLPYALPELEAVVRTLDPALSDAENQFQFYGLLAEAYAANGRLNSEFERLTALVRAGRAGKKDLLLWMELAVRLPRESVKDLPVLAEQTLLAGGTPGDYQRIQLARLYARAGRSEQAIGLYSVATVSALVSTDYRFSRSEGLALFSAMGLCLDAERHLDLESQAGYFNQLAQITKPSGGPAFEVWHQRFALWILDRASVARVPAERVRGLLPALETSKARREDLIRFAGSQSRLVGTEPALASLKIALRKGADPQPAPSSSPFENNAVRYSMNLGFRSTQFNSGPNDAANEPPLLLAFKGLFPTRADAWPTAREWVVRSAQAIPGWIASSEVDPDLALQVLALLTLRQQQMGLPEAATSAKELSQLLERPQRISPATATLAVAVAERVKAPINLGVARKLVANRSLDVRLLANLLQRSAKTEGTPAALALGEIALDYTRNEALLRELESLAKNSGDAVAVRRYAQLRQQAASARTLLDDRVSPAPSSRISAIE